MIFQIVNSVRKILLRRFLKVVNLKRASLGAGLLQDPHLLLDQGAHTAVLEHVVASNGYNRDFPARRMTIDSLSFDLCSQLDVIIAHLFERVT